MSILEVLQRTAIVHGMFAEIIIVGGGLNGLTAAALLAHHGVRCIVIERHASTHTVQIRGHFSTQHGDFPQPWTGG